MYKFCSQNLNWCFEQLNKYLAFIAAETQETITCSKSTTKTLEKNVKYVQS